MSKLNTHYYLKCNTCKSPVNAIIGCPANNFIGSYPSTKYKVKIKIIPCPTCMNRAEKMAIRLNKSIREGMVFEYTDEDNNSLKCFLTLFKTGYGKFMLFDLSSKTFNRWNDEVLDSSLTLKDMKNKGFEFVSEPKTK